MSGTLWAVAYDLAVRSLLFVVPRSLGRPGMFADDLGMDIRHRVEAMLALEPVLCDMGVAANVWPYILDFSAEPRGMLRTELRLLELFAEVHVVRHGRYLGVLVGLDVAERAGGVVVGKCRTRARHVIGMLLQLRQWVRVYCTFAFSMLRFLMRVARPVQEVYRAEQAVVAPPTRLPCTRSPVLAACGCEGEVAGCDGHSPRISYEDSCLTPCRPHWD